MMVSVGDVRLYVDVDGAKLVPDGESMRERPTIVMLHGNGADHSPFKEVLAGFTDFAQVVYYDHRGHGRSDDGEPDRWNLDQWADDLVALCEGLGIDRPVLFGVSFGGNITLNCAIRYPNHPVKIVVSCGARINPEASIRTYAHLGGPDVAAVAAGWYEAPADRVDEFLRVVARTSARCPASSTLPLALCRAPPSPNTSFGTSTCNTTTGTASRIFAARRCYSEANSTLSFPLTRSRTPLVACDPDWRGSCASQRRGTERLA